MASSPHKEFRDCTIICYARHFFNKGEEIGDLSDENYEEENNKPRKKSSLNLLRRKTLDKNFNPEKLNELKEITSKIIESKSCNDDDDLYLPEGISRIERHEKIITDGNTKKKLIKVKKFKEDGTVMLEVFKENIK